VPAEPPSLAAFLAAREEDDEAAAIALSRIRREIRRRVADAEHFLTMAKVCTRCGRTLPASAFGQTANGRKPQCRECRLALERKWRTQRAARAAAPV
jgi:DNA-directed RNA polymerase subunit RPC12/RpoP